MTICRRGSIACVDDVTILLLLSIDRHGVIPVVYKCESHDPVFGIRSGCLNGHDFSLGKPLNVG